tara:strand:+ start:257 stop:841 length:585 start_codon:yes stop_codon:yes gene_type:complete
MISVSALNNVHNKGFYGNHENQNKEELIKICEVKNLLIVQIVQYKNISFNTEIKIDGLSLKDEVLTVNSNDDTRILWNGPKNWLLISTKKDLIKDIKQSFKEENFAITDLSHSKAVIELQGKNLKEILKKGCPINVNEIKKNNSFNSIFHNISVTVDIIDDNPEKIRILTLRSFGESLYHSITDSCLEYGFENT